MSYTTRLTSFTCLIQLKIKICSFFQNPHDAIICYSQRTELQILVETVLKKSVVKEYQSAVIPSELLIALNAITNCKRSNQEDSQSEHQAMAKVISPKHCLYAHPMCTLISLNANSLVWNKHCKSLPNIII